MMTVTYDETTWKLVPVEPDDAMTTAPNTIIQAYGAKLIYQRMLAAAPLPPVVARKVLDWVSVDERLPEKGVSVLVFYPSDPAKPYCIDMWDEWHEDPIGIGGAMCVYEGWMSFDFEDITHWMPLPDVPVERNLMGESK